MLTIFTKVVTIFNLLMSLQRPIRSGQPLAACFASAHAKRFDFPEGSGYVSVILIKYTKDIKSV